MPSETSHPRRKFLKAVLTTSAAICLGVGGISNAIAGPEDDWRLALLQRDRWLSLERKASGEAATFIYYRQGRGYDPDGYRKACHLLRDVQYGVTFEMAPHLLDLMYLMQEWLRDHGLPYKMVILSGYRTPAHNASIRTAAKKSEHMNGNAVDLYIPGVSTQNLYRLALAVGGGGVGIYPKKKFVHVDVGRLRKWRG